MISSKACRCSRSRRRSSAAMCRFQGGKPAARSPDAISAARRERAAAARAARAAALEGWPRGRGRGGGPESREAAGGGRPARGEASAVARSALSEPGLGRRHGPQPPPHARHSAAAALCQGPSPLSGAPQQRQQLPAAARHRPPPLPAPLGPLPLSPRRVEPRRGRTATAESASSTDGRAGGRTPL